MLKIALFSRIALIHSMKMDIFDLKVTSKNCEIALFEFALLEESLYCCCQCNIMSPKFDFIVIIKKLRVLFLYTQTIYELYYICMYVLNTCTWCGNATF